MLKKRTTVKKTCKKTVKKSSVRVKKGAWSLFGKKKPTKRKSGHGIGLTMIAKNKKEAKRQFEDIGLKVDKVSKNKKGGYKVYHHI